jgi:hypothetical protein
MFAFLKNGLIIGCGLIASVEEKVDSVSVDTATYLDLFNIDEHSKYSIVNNTLYKNEFQRSLGQTTLAPIVTTNEDLSKIDVLLSVIEEVASLVLSDKANKLLKKEDCLGIFYIEKTEGYINAKNSFVETLYLDTEFSLTLPNNTNVFIVQPFTELTYGIHYEYETT